MCYDSVINKAIFRSKFCN